jgi:hypothetical protein
VCDCDAYLIFGERGIFVSLFSYLQEKHQPFTTRNVKMSTKQEKLLAVVADLGTGKFDLCE